jgi:hypothetical protein
LFIQQLQDEQMSEGTTEIDGPERSDIQMSNPNAGTEDETAASSSLKSIKRLARGYAFRQLNCVGNKLMLDSDASALTNTSSRMHAVEAPIQALVKKGKEKVEEEERKITTIVHAQVRKLYMEVMAGVFVTSVLAQLFVRYFL